MLNLLHLSCIWIPTFLALAPAALTYSARSLAVMSFIDRIPDELLEAILNLAMIDGTPFDLNECVRAAKRKTFPRLGFAGWQTLDPSLAEHDRKRLWDTYKTEAENRKRKTQTLQTSCSLCKNQRSDTSRSHLYRCFCWLLDDFRCWSLYASSVDSQRPHLLDWRLAGSVCRRWRKMGKTVFWRQRVIAMDLTIARKIQLSNMTHLSKEDQQIAAKCITSVVFISPTLSSPASFLTLPKCVTGFPDLRYVDFYFGQRQENPAAGLMKASQQRRQAPQHFLDVLLAIGACTEKLDVGILIDTSTNWTYEEERLKRYVYPLLTKWADVKCADTKNKMKALQTEDQAVPHTGMNNQVDAC